MVNKIKTFGRTELAQLYFPKLCPEAAWHKLRQWITINPTLSHLRELRRRTFTPAEVQCLTLKNVESKTTFKWRKLKNLTC